MPKPVTASTLLIDTSFFVGEINIPNAQKPEVKESLELFIAKGEQQLLRQLFGHELYVSYAADSTTQRFQDLIYGEDFDYWRGLIYDITPSSGTNIVRGSLIADYIYTWWIKDKQLWNSGVGIVRPKGDNSEVMPISLKIMNAWNQFSHQVYEFVFFMNANIDVYPEWSPINLWEFRVINDFDI
jgi:hypothetical protein